MGLDQYAYKRARKEYASKEEADNALDLIVAWRKHNRLQGWMENLWMEKGNEEDLNCQLMQLTLEDIENLEADIENEALPETAGFFFGEDSYGYKTEDGRYEDYQADKKFIKEAKEALANNYDVFYTCWW